MSSYKSARVSSEAQTYIPVVDPRLEQEQKQSKAVKYAQRFVDTTITSPLGIKAKAAGWDNKLIGYAHSCAEYFSLYGQKSRVIGHDIYRHIHGVSNGYERTNQILKSLRDQVDKGSRELQLPFIDEFADIWGKAN